MTFIKIENFNNPDLEIYKQLRDSVFSKDNSFIADSPKVVNMLLQTSIEVKSILATQEYYDESKDLLLNKKISKLYVADKKLMQEIVGHNIHHNCMMHAIRPKEYDLDALDENIIMLDEISSTENIGSIARSAAALGVHSYLVPRQGPHPYSRRSVRVSMGHISMLKTHMYDDIFVTLKKLQDNGYTIIAAEVASGSIDLAKLEIPKKWVLLMGHEGKGISKEILQACDKIVKIEMQEGIKSFNVGVAASILMYKLKIKT